MLTWLIIGAAFFFLFTSLWGLFIAVRPSKIVSSHTPKDLGLTYEDVTFQTLDELTLSGWFIPRQRYGEVLTDEKSKTIVLLHGYPADKGDILPAMAFLVEDFHLFLFDFRYFGKSEGRLTTVGAREKNDLLAAIRFLETRKIDAVGVWGFSMGGAVALSTAAESSTMKAVVSDSSYASLRDLAPMIYQLPVLKYPLAFLTILWARLFAGIDVEKASPLRNIRDLRQPVLLIHSRSDQVIPFSQALQLQSALQHNPQVEFWFPEDLPHGQFAEEYQKRVKEFFQRRL